MTLTWGSSSDLSIDLRFLTAFTCLETLTLDAGRRDVRFPPGPLPFLRSLDISRTHIPLTIFGDISVNGRDEKTQQRSSHVGWSTLTRLAPYMRFETRDLLCLPDSLVELDLRRTGALHDTFVDLLTAPTNVSTSPLGSPYPILPRAMRRLILPHNCLVVPTKKLVPTTATHDIVTDGWGGDNHTDISVPGREVRADLDDLRQRLNQPATLANGISVTFV